VPDIFSYEIVEELRLPACPLCRALAADERRWVDSFWREGKNDAASRRGFLAAGGFCRRHGWLLRELVAAADAGAAIADLDGRLADEDVRRLARLANGLERGRHRRVRALAWRGECPACGACENALSRKTQYVGKER
jgi:hypothetical protein